MRAGRRSMISPSPICWGRAQGGRLDRLARRRPHSRCRRRHRARAAHVPGGDARHRRRPLRADAEARRRPRRRAATRPGRRPRPHGCEPARLCGRQLRLRRRALSADRRAGPGGDFGRARPRGAAGRRDRARQSRQLAGRAIALFESYIGKRLASLLGWRVLFPWSIIGDWIDSRPDMRLIDRRIVPPFGLFTLTRVERLATSGDHARPPIYSDVRPIEQV